jgi:hypothetical protein
MAVEAAADPRTSQIFPQSGSRYAVVVASVIRMHQHVESIQALGGRPDRPGANEMAGLEYRQRVAEIMRLGQVVDGELQSLTAMFRAAMEPRAFSGR